MPDTAAITIAIISLVAAALTAGVTSWLTYSTDKWKAMREREGVLQKYRDPLLFAALDLQERLVDILGKKMEKLSREPGRVFQDWVFIYTAFVFGQYFAWVYILRQKAQFIAFVSKGRGKGRIKDLTCALDAIEEVLNKEYNLEDELPFNLWKDHQMAIGEIMTKRDCDQELLCMGLAEFSQEWKKEEADISSLVSDGDQNAPNRQQDNNNQSSINATSAATPTPFVIDYTKPPPANPPGYRLHTWLWTIPCSVQKFHALHIGNKDCTEDRRIRELQHRLIDLIEVLDPDGLRTNEERVRRCERAKICACRECGTKQKGKLKETV